MTRTAAKLTLTDGSIDFLLEEDETIRMLVERHTQVALTGAVSFLDDVEVKTASGRRVTLKEIRTIE